MHLDLAGILENDLRMDLRVLSDGKIVSTAEIFRFTQ